MTIICPGGRVPNWNNLGKLSPTEVSLPNLQTLIGMNELLGVAGQH